nr:MAG TPA: hypothetical protein [Myoviridae sp. ctfuG5]
MTPPLCLIFLKEISRLSRFDYIYRRYFLSILYLIK